MPFSAFDSALWFATPRTRETAAGLDSVISPTFKRERAQTSGLALHVALSAIARGFKRRSARIVTAPAEGLSRLGSLMHTGFEVDRFARLGEQLVVACRTVVFRQFGMLRMIERNVAVPGVKDDFVGRLLRHQKIDARSSRKCNEY